MALTKRGKTWHTQFFVDSERFRQSLETSDWREAQRKERVLMGEAKSGKLAASKDDFTRLPFAAAAERFLEDRIPHLAPRSIQTERERVKPINKALGDVAVWRMTVGQVTAYIRERKRPADRTPRSTESWTSSGEFSSGRSAGTTSRRRFTLCQFARTSGGR